MFFLVRFLPRRRHCAVRCREAPTRTDLVTMADACEEGVRLVMDLRSAAESAGGDEAHATPLHEVESLCMRCGENVSSLSAHHNPYSPSVSALSGD